MVHLKETQILRCFHQPQHKVVTIFLVKNETYNTIQYLDIQGMECNFYTGNVFKGILSAGCTFNFQLA